LADCAIKYEGGVRQKRNVDIVDVAVPQCGVERRDVNEDVECREKVSEVWFEDEGESEVGEGKQGGRDVEREGRVRR
jgi:hypothetical protein